MSLRILLCVSWWRSLVFYLHIYASLLHTTDVRARWRRSSCKAGEMLLCNYHTVLRAITLTKKRLWELQTCILFVLQLRESLKYAKGTEFFCDTRSLISRGFQLRNIPTAHTQHVTSPSFRWVVTGGVLGYISDLGNIFYSTFINETLPLRYCCVFWSHKHLLGALQPRPNTEHHFCIGTLLCLAVSLLTVSYSMRLALSRLQTGSLVLWEGSCTRHPSAPHLPTLLITTATCRDAWSVTWRQNNSGSIPGSGTHAPDRLEHPPISYPIQIWLFSSA
jgi:hypothetical protein